MNFEFVKDFPDFNPLYKSCYAAEMNIFIDPPTSMVSSRTALEYIVKFIHKTALGNDIFDMKLSDMMTDYDFVNYINDKSVINEMHSIRKMGNIAAHDHIGTKDEATDVLESLLFVVGELFITLGLLKDYPVFEVPANPLAKEVTAPAPVVVNNEMVVVDDNVAAKFAVAMRHAKFDTTYKRDAEENRLIFIKACLREAGWPIVEEDNHAKPFCAGKSIVVDATDTIDYVLYGKDGKPLAIIEYSECKENLIQSKRKANRVAAKLEAQYGVLPIVYFTNGYMIQIIDQLGYPQRRIFSFHSMQELEWLIFQRTNRKPLENLQIRNDITDRYYQHEAINAVCSAFAQKRRGSLIVMATGTGKTRVSISIVDVLMKYGWVKNVLFLADRTSLVRQAMKNFKKLMPSVTTSLYTGDSISKDSSARLVFSTYQSMIRVVNGENRTFGIGRFDLIIVDEAHRSIFTKYAGLFTYFDALMLGLTATPKYEQDRSSYEVFKLPKPEPDYAYELDQALKDKYLVGFAIKNRTTEKNLRKFKYSDLSAQEIQEIEDSLAENYSQKEIQTFRVSHYDKSGVRTTTINRSTIRIMLDDLMENGLKLADGTLGKTIIFATTHHEAEVIVEEFNTRFATYGSNFCKLIDSKIPERYALIDKLEERDSGLQIAVSVEMLETGVDIPDLLNLVFYKPTLSKIKFLQMIGRGTRLSKDLFGPGLDKKGFMIFDYFDNFRFFSTGATWSTIGGSSVNNSFYKNVFFEGDAIAINKFKLSIAHYTQTHACSDYDKKYGDELIEELVSKTENLQNDDINIQYNLPYINKYRAPEMWKHLNEERIDEITERIFRIFPGDGTNPQVRKFDHIMYSIEEQVTWLAERQPKRYKKTIEDIKIGGTSAWYLLDQIASSLEEYMQVPEILEHADEIRRLHEGYSVKENFSLENCENIRKSLRDLMRHIPLVNNSFVIDVQDSIVKEATGAKSAGEIKTEKPYPERAMEYLANAQDSEFTKLRNLEPLTDDEKNKVDGIFTQKLGTKVDFQMWADNKPMLAFIRSKVGISDEAIVKNFGSFLNEQVMTEEQLKVANQIIEYAKVNGDVTAKVLSEVEPFKTIDFMKFFGKNALHIKTIISTIHNAIN